MMITTKPTTREAWLAQRQAYIGSSEVAALFGVQAAYQLSHFALWHVKRGIEPPPVEGPRVRWGNRLEAVIAAAVAEEHGMEVSPGRYAVADGCRAAASLDFEITVDPAGEFPGPGALETKNVDWMIHRRQWTDGEPPPHILLQLQHQLLCTGWAWGAVAGLVGGNELKVYRYAARPKLLADIRRRVDAFWASESPPPVDGSDGASAILAAIYSDPVDDAVDMTLSNEWPEAVQAFIDAAAAKKAATEDYDLARNRVAALLGNHRRGWGGGYSVNTAISAAKPDRIAEPGEIIRGRSESRRYIAKIQEVVG